MRDSRRTRLVLGLLLIASLSLLTVDYRSEGSAPLAFLRDAGAAVFGPIESAAAATAERMRHAAAGFADARAQQQRIESLRRENARLRTRLRSQRLAAERATELEGLADLAGRGRYRIVPAEVVAVRSALGFERTATIDVGRRDGVTRDMTVVCAQGLVGRVVHVGTTTSTVLLAIDRSSRVGARLAGSDEIGVVRGGGGGTMKLKLLDSGARVTPGTRLVTFGSQGGTPYVGGVPIGTVTSVAPESGALAPKARVRPFVDFSSLDLVGVVVAPPRRNPRDAVLPPRPASEPPGGQRDGGPGGAPGREQGPEEASEEGRARSPERGGSGGGSADTPESEPGTDPGARVPGGPDRRAAPEV